ncbi:hypothetical protein J7L13_00255, partial [bacterium]|nr:hypothetical protein [bacterium]
TRLFKDFVRALRLADKLLLLEVYEVAGREFGGKKKTSKDLAQALKKEGKEVAYAKNYREAECKIPEMLSRKEVLVFMSAGPIDKLAHLLLKKYG